MRVCQGLDRLVPKGLFLSIVLALSFFSPQSAISATNTNALSHVTLSSIQCEMLHCVQHDKKSVILSASEESHSF